MSLNYVHNCKNCTDRCDGRSLKKYNFNNDVEFSEKYENSIIDKINEIPKYRAVKTDTNGYPDIEIFHDENGFLKSYLEIKVQGRTFMKIRNRVPKSNLSPSECVALNLSDLLRYFKISQNTNTPTSIMWVLLNRPCINKDSKESYFYQKTEVLRSIYEKERDSRRFKRESGAGDVVNGVHKGVLVNYHFSLSELIPWKFDK